MISNSLRWPGRYNKVVPSKINGLILGLTAALAGAACSAPAHAEVPVTYITATPSPTDTLTPAPSRTVTATPWPTPSLIPTATATPVCAETRGRVMQEKFESRAINEMINLRIYLPPCYATHTWQRYPVLYLIHGLNMDESIWDEIGADETANDLITRGDIPPVIIVMPFAPDDPRFVETVAFDLLPHIDSAYRTKADRAYRALGGMSRGGGWTIRIGLQYPGLFSALGLHSLAIFFADEEAIIPWLNKLPADNTPRIYIDIGQGDSLLRSAMWFDEALTTRAIAHEFHLYAGRHEPAYWSEHLPEYLRWYTAEW